MNSSATHPLAGAWLRDLELLLHGIEPGERAEVLAGVREHLDGSLPPGASDDDVRRVLADLGSPQSVADEAYADRPATSSSGQSMRWAAVAACGLNILGLVLVSFLTWTAIGAKAIMAGGFLFALPWSAVFVLSMLATTWTPRQRAASALLYPAVLVGYSTAAWAMPFLIGSTLVNIVPVVLMFLAAVWVLAKLLRAALR